MPPLTKCVAVRPALYSPARRLVPSNIITRGAKQNRSKPQAPRLRDIGKWAESELYQKEEKGSEIFGRQLDRFEGSDRGYKTEKSVRRQARPPRDWQSPAERPEQGDGLGTSRRARNKLKTAYVRDLARQDLENMARMDLDDSGRKQRFSGPRLLDGKSFRKRAKSEKVRHPEPIIIKAAKKMLQWRQQCRANKKRVALVPTMGALHEGHLSLIEAAAKENDEIIVSIFVNPTQFGPTEDLATYPKTFESDMEKIVALNRRLLENRSQGLVTAVFVPQVATMYPRAQRNKPLPANLSYVVVDPSLTGILEGETRPTFFRGVTTVVMKLFWLTLPDNAYFGEKDAQQLAVIRRMVVEFQIPIRICGVPISRDESGLALSSRNAYLGERRRNVALVLSRMLAAARQALDEGKTSREEVMDRAGQVARDELRRQEALPPSERARFEVEYLSMAGYQGMEEVDDAVIHPKVVLSGVVVMLPLEEPQDGEVLGTGGDQKKVRLLDNFTWINLSYSWRKKQLAAADDGSRSGEDMNDEKKDELDDDEEISLDKMSEIKDLKEIEEMYQRR